MIVNLEKYFLLEIFAVYGSYNWASKVSPTLASQRGFVYIYVLVLELSLPTVHLHSGTCDRDFY